MKIRIFLMLIIFFFCLLGFIFIKKALFPSPPGELSELSQTHYIEAKIWIKHNECLWTDDLTINGKQKTVPITNLMQSYADGDWMPYMPSAPGNLFLNFYNESENRIFSIVVSLIIFRGEQSYFLTQINGPSISITNSEFKELTALLDIDEDCAVVKN